MRLIEKRKIWNNGYVEMYDMADTVINSVTRRDTVCEIAKVCRNIDKIKDKDFLFDRLSKEAYGKPSAIFEFVPEMRYGAISNLRKVYEKCTHDFTEDVDPYAFIVFKLKLPMMIVPHLLRHRKFSFNQRSNRMTKNTEYYYCSDFDNYWGDHKIEQWSEICYNNSPKNWDDAKKEYKIRQELTNKRSAGLSYTELYIAAWAQTPDTWKNLFDQRIRSRGVQRETNEICEMMQDLIIEHKPSLERFIK